MTNYVLKNLLFDNIWVVPLQRELRIKIILLKKKEENNNSISNIADNNINRDLKQVELPSKEKICDKCYYTNGEMAYCISIDKIKYVFDEKGNFKEMIQLSDEEFSKIMSEQGIKPDNFTVVTENSE